MKQVGVFEGKTHFSALIDAAAHGETIVVTKHGKPVAQIGPVDVEERRARAKAAMERMLASNIRLDGITIRELIDEGRRY